MEPNTTQEKSNGALVGLVIIIIILIVGGIYLWQSNMNKNSIDDSVGTTDQMETTAGAQAVTSQDAAALDSLDQETQNTDTSTGVDVNAVN